MFQNLQKIAKFQKMQLDNLVDFEKCCKTRIFLQRSVPIQPKTSNNLPKFYRSAVARPAHRARRDRGLRARGAGRRRGGLRRAGPLAKLANMAKVANLAKFCMP